MTLIASSEKLTQQLNSDETLLILFGDEARTVEVYDKAKQMKDEEELAQRHVPLWVKELGILSPSQKETWNATSGQYVVLRVNALAERDIISEGSVTIFMTIRNVPGKTKILRAFRGRL